MKLTEKIVRENLLKCGYEWIDGEYKNNQSKLTLLDKDGYKYLTSYSNVVNGGKKSNICSKFNPYSIDNIKQYIINNNLKTKYYSGKYVNAKETNLVFGCECCGKPYIRSWSNFQTKKNFKCKECNRIVDSLSFEEVSKCLVELGYSVISDSSSFEYMSKSKIDAMDKDGYKYSLLFRDYRYDHTLAKFGLNNPYTIDNINVHLSNSFNDEYTCISKNYENNHSELEILHKTCGRTFKTCWDYLYRNPTEKYPNRKPSLCPYCQRTKTESVHALVLKQVWKHEYPDTVLEDRSCISTITGYALPTDIVNHEQKIAIEVQSNFHDKEKQKKKDKIKKNYWLNNGYKFYAVDIRDYSIIEMVNVFFPDIHEIPDYVDFNFSNTLDVFEAQKLLNKHMKLKDIANTMNVNIHQINDAISFNRLIYPEGYRKDNVTAIVQLTYDLKYVKTFDKIRDVKQDGFNPNSITSCLYYKRYSSQGYLWFLFNRL